MSFDKYEKADCTLFRLPPLDFSTADKIIEQAILRAWQQGSAPGAALHEVMADQNLLRDLVKQVAPNLQFQQQHAEEQLEKEKGKKVHAYEAEKQQSVKEVTKAASEEAVKRQEAFVAAQQRADERRQLYSARKQKLEEIRARLKIKLGDIGGKEGFVALQQINSMVMSGAEPSEADAITPRLRGVYGARRIAEYKSLTAPSIAATKASSGLEGKVAEAAQASAVSLLDVSKVLELVTTDAVVDPLAERKAREIQEEGGNERRDKAVKEKKPGHMYEWFHRTPARETIYRILTYKVW